MSTLAQISSIADIEAQLAPLRERLAKHPLYASMRTERDLRLFMQSHVFAVWDFMSLLKSLQARLTSVTSPWVPTPYPASRRFINEIVLGEESDEFPHMDGTREPISHFELYLRAMQQAGADTSKIEGLLAAVAGEPVLGAIKQALMPAGAKAFITSTFTLIEQGGLHALAAAFTFGREDVIPDMFRSLVRDLSRATEGSFDTFIWYLERHIEVDGADHGPLSLRMVEDLCGDEEIRWEQAAGTAMHALEARLAFWDAILAEIGAEIEAA